jgi:predicted ATP-binding protein involved in virulence
MRVEQLELTNFRGIRHLSLAFPTQTTVLVGINGVGKSAVLDALAILLGRVIQKLELTSREDVPHLAERDLRVGAKDLRVAVGMSHGNTPREWALVVKEGSYRRFEYPEVEGDLILFNAIPTGTEVFGPVPLVVQYSTSRGQWSSTQHLDQETPRGRAAAFKNALPAGVGTFDAFYAWFREREDIENEERAQGKLEFKDPQLEAVRAAVAALLQGFSNLRIERKLRRMTVQKHDEVLDVTQLSAGEKALLTLVSDLARRLSIANPDEKDPRLGQGVVLIDEVDLHLHPRWQRMLLPALARTFPECQFIVTTHSPQVISEVKPESIYLLERTKDGEIIASRPEASFGRDSSRILEDLMGTDARPSPIKEQLHQLFRLIDDGKLEEAKALRLELETKIGSSEPEFAKSDVLIRRKEMLASASDRPRR